MKTKQSVGIVGYGAYIPSYRLATKDISNIWRGGRDLDSLPVEAVSLPSPDEDIVTMAVEASKNAFLRSQMNEISIEAVYIGSESHPYEVKSTGSIVAEILGITEKTTAADFQFGSKAGSEAIQACFAMVGSGMTNYALGIGVDSAQVKPGDELEYTAASGAAAIIIGKSDKALAILDASTSFVTDTPDFFRRSYQKYPVHGNRFTGEPGYFYHIENSVKNLLKELDIKQEEYSAVVFHQPNERFPRKIASRLGFTEKQLSKGLICKKIGNTYSSSALLGMMAVLDNARPGEKILMASYGAGAGSDAMSFTVTDRILDVVNLAPTTSSYIKRMQFVDYLTYARLKGKIRFN